MRVRLRAPEETEPPPPTQSLALAYAPPTAPPHMDAFCLRSPEFIEQRLENLKRKTSWLAYLDQCVDAFPEDEDGNPLPTVNETEAHEREHCEGEGREPDVDDETEVDDIVADSDPGSLVHLLVSMGVVALTPVWIVTFPCWHGKGPEFWPLGCSSLPSLYVRSVSYLLFILFGASMMYYTMCKELPEWDPHTWTILRVQGREMVDSIASCRVAVLNGASEAVARELCAPIVVNAATLIIALWLTIKAYHRWARYLLVGMGLLLFVDTPSKLNRALQPMPQIERIDPTYALLGEEILVSITGKNLQPGGTVGWVAYWGCASSIPASACEVQFPGLFEMGVVPVTFESIDHFVPCYRNPPNPLKTEEFYCFEYLRLRVKDKHSIPGWSKGSAVAAVTQISMEIQQPPPQDRRLEEQVKKTKKSKRHTQHRDREQEMKSVSVDAYGDVEKD